MKIPESVIEAGGMAFFTEENVTSFNARFTSGLTAALAEWEKLGMVMRPKEATPAMVKAAHSALYHYRERVLKDPQQDPTNDEKHAIRYRAMIAAGEEK